MHGFSRVGQAVVRFALILSLVVPTLASLSAQRAEATVDVASLSASSSGVGLFRTRVVISDPSARARLDRLGVVVLEEGPGWALVLADADQLEALARLRFEPQATDDLGMLVETQGWAKPGLVASVQPLLIRAEAVRDLADVGGGVYASARTALRSAMQTLSPQAQAEIAGFSAVDDDADGLTNLQEEWWCTDPLNPDTDSDGISDGDEIQMLKDWLTNQRANPPGGTPWPDWPFNDATCPDKDHDSIPNLAERWELGLHMDRESTDFDKFDDGQELFGVTYCPGGDLNCGYGDLPRSSDSGYVGATMPSWVEAPGNHPLVAAFPVPEIDVVESSLHVETVTTVTTDHTITEGTERSYSTAKTEGTSTSVANTVTWNEWQEVSESWQERVIGGQILTFQASGNSSFFDNLKRRIIRAVNYRRAHAIAREGCLNTTSNFNVGLDLGFKLDFGAEFEFDAEYTNARCRGALRRAREISPEFAQEFPDEENKYFPASVRFDPITEVNLLNQIVLNNAIDTSNIAAGLEGIQYAQLQSGQFIGQRLYEIATILSAPVRATTTAQGRSWGGAQTTTNTEYEEHTITNGEAFSSAESWSTATAVDSSHAADLWFTYRVRNTGDEYAREICDLAFNIYIGDDPNPAYTYFVGPDIGGDGCFNIFMPGEEHTYTSRRIPLTLEQMRAIDLGGPVRIVVEDYTYGVADESFYQNAVNAGVLIAIEDGTDDSDEAIDTYLIPTWGEETVLDVLARYFPYETDAYGNLIAIWTPEYGLADTPSWCVEPRVVGVGGQRTLWCKHALSTADWWNIYTDGLGDGSEGLQDTPAAPGSVALFRFNKDTDLDGYSDRSEARLGTDPNDPADHPQPELIAGVHSIRVGNHVTATLSLLNTGLYDAYGVEAVMIAPDDSVSITNNTVGGSGRVRAQRQVIVGSRILPPQYDASTWHGTATPMSAGYYEGTQDRVYTFTVNCSNPGGCEVSNGTWTLDWDDGTGNTGTLNLGDGYASPTPLDVGSLGVKVALLSGTVYDGDTFTVEARTPRDTFQYTINREPYTEPVVIVSYNDPQGNHRFVTPVALGHPTDDLVPYSGQMLKGLGAEIVTQAPVTTTGTYTTNVVVNWPIETTLEDAHLFLEFVNISGTVTAEFPVTVTLEPGPTVVPVQWSTDVFSPTFQPDEDYIVMVFWTDWEGNIIDTAARPLSSFQADPKPVFAMADADATWDFGSVPQGTILKRTFTFANTGLLDLLTYVSAPPEMSLSQQGSQRVGPADVTTYEITLDTANLPTGPYDEAITIRTSDPDNPVRTVHVVGNIIAATPDTPPGDTLRPLDWDAYIPGDHSQGEWVEFTHTLGPDPQSLHPVKVYSQDYGTLWGVGKYATAFGEGTASYDMFGDGSDGDLVVGSGQTVYVDNVRTIVAGTAAAGQNVVPVANTAGFNEGDEVLIYQVQGLTAGSYEFGVVTNKTGGSLVLEEDLSHSYRGTLCGSGFRGEYFTNRNLSGSPAMVRCDRTIWFDWGVGSPGGGVPADNFSVRWTAEVYFPSTDTYSFWATHDDGIRVYIDSSLILDEWHPAASETHGIDITVSQGWHTLRIEYYEEGGGAVIFFWYPENLVFPSAQVIRVPHYRNVTVYPGGTISSHSWNGSTGGVIAFRVSESADIRGQITATGRGFRGGKGSTKDRPGCQGEGHTGPGELVSPQVGYGGVVNNNGNGGGGGNGRWFLGADWHYAAGGAGGGNGSSGGRGQGYNDPVHGSAGGYGGSAVGNTALTLLFMGGGGGEGGSGTDTSGRNGGNGGGVMLLFPREFILTGSIQANGNNAEGNAGGSGDSFYGAGGGGAGGSILVRASEASIGSNRITALGGMGGAGISDDGAGGNGGVGRIRIEYCDTLSGSTDPPASTQKLNCYIVEQIEQSPYNRARLNLPESFTGGRHYWVQYGRRFVFGGAGEQTATLRVPAGAFTNATLDALVSNVGSGSLTFRLDIGNDGSWDWQVTQNVDGSATLSSPNLAAAFNQYWATHGAPTSGDVDVPVRVYLSKAGQVLLTDLVMTPTGSKVRYARLPARDYGAVTLDLTVGESGSGSLTLAADVGDDGTVDWTWTGSATYPAHLTTDNLASAFNAYLSGQSGDVSVPIRFYVAPFLSLHLGDFSATPSAQPDVGLTAADISFGVSNPTEGETVPVTVTLHNESGLDSGSLTAAFYATAPGWGEWYVGSAFVPNVPAGGTTQATIRWNTLGFTGTVPVRVVVDPYDRLAETDETNNEATTDFVILTRPDLDIPAIALSDDEPVAGETVTVTLTVHNAGQTTAGSQTVALYEGNPDTGGTAVGAQGLAPLPGIHTDTVSLTWTPTAPGPYRLFAQADRDDEVDEYDEGDNQTWRDVYVGFAGPILLDSGGDPDPVYTSTLGYGYLNADTRVVSCGTGPEDTLRAANSDTLYYRFDHLLPGHFYHLDITLRDCDGTRAEEVYVDDSLVAPAVDLSDHLPHRISIRLDPALYTDHTVVVGIREIHGLDAMVAEVSLHDVDYRYADAGGANDPTYPAPGVERPYGWLDGEPLTTWGSLPYQTVRMDRADTDPSDDPDNELRYRFDDLRPDSRYRLHLTFRQMTGATVVQKVQIDGVDASPSFNLDHGRTYTVTLSVPPEAYAADSSIIVSIVRVDCVTSEAFVNEIALEEETLPAGDPCSGVAATPARTIAYGSVTINGEPAPVGTVIQALNPRDEVVGCAVVQQAGQYPYMQIYGEDPPIPGMRQGEIVEFRVNGIPAVAEPSLYWQNDQTPHQVDLSIGSTEGQCIWLQPNWNLTSFRLRPPVPPVEDVLRSIDGRYCRVLGETGVYDCEIDPVYRTLTEMEPGLGYYVRLTTTMGANLRVEGLPVPVTTPLPLHTYWNWVGYLPTTTLPITQALQSIDGHYLLVHSLDATYNPADPVHSTLWEMEPGQGYLIRATDPVTLVYPAGGGVMQTQAWSARLAGAGITSTACDGVTPTPDFTVVYGSLTINGKPAPAGTRVEVLTPRGEVAGCFVVGYAGEYGYVHAYGEDPSDPPIPGFREDEPLAFRVNGLPATPSETLLWQNDKTPHQVDLSLTVHYVHLPIVARSW